MNVYFISGLGADKRAFQKIILPASFNTIHIDWILPIKNETLTNYSLRLAERIDTLRPFVLIGLSFGGIVACELTKVLTPVKSIIISSASSNKQIPWYFKLIGGLGINKIIPTRILKFKNYFTFWLFGAKTIEEKNLLAQILEDTDEVYLKWAINVILHWRNEEKPANIFHIHGTEDKILPIRFTQPDAIIKDGRHFMVFSKHDEVNKIINTQLNDLLTKK